MNWNQCTGQLTDALRRPGQRATKLCKSTRAQEQKPDNHSHAEEPPLNTGTRAHHQAHKEKECVRERPFSGVTEHRQSGLPPRSVLGVRYPGPLGLACRSAARALAPTSLDH
jgi:hypothetical protein